MVLTPIYNSRGDADAFLEYPYIFNRSGDWVGFVTPTRDVYSVLGVYIGYLTDDPRIFRRQAISSSKPVIQPPTPPEKVHPPAMAPLAPLMSEPPRTTVDVLLEEPELLHARDAGDMRDDAE